MPTVPPSFKRCLILAETAHDGLPDSDIHCVIRPILSERREQLPVKKETPPFFRAERPGVRIRRVGTAKASLKKLFTFLRGNLNALATDLVWQLPELASPAQAGLVDAWAI